MRLATSAGVRSNASAMVLRSVAGSRLYCSHSCPSTHPCTHAHRQRERERDGGEGERACEKEARHGEQEFARVWCVYVCI
jgi:hypothetical protein